MQGNGALKTGDAGASFGKDGVFGVNARGFGAAADPFPPALIRRGSFGSGSTASGVCSLDATLGPDGPLSNVGFRCGRPKYLVGACWPWRRDSGWIMMSSQVGFWRGLCSRCVLVLPLLAVSLALRHLHSLYEEHAIRFTD